MDSYIIWTHTHIQNGLIYNMDSYTIWTHIQYGLIYNMDSYTIWTHIQYGLIYNMDSYSYTIWTHIQYGLNNPSYCSVYDPPSDKNTS